MPLPLHYQTLNICNISVILKMAAGLVISKKIARFRSGGLPELLYRVPSQASWPGASIYTPFQPYAPSPWGLNYVIHFIFYV